MSETLDAIRTRAKAYAENGTPGLAAPRDRAELLAIVDAQQAQLEAVEALAERWAGLDDSPAARSNRLRALRAAMEAQQ